MSSVDVMEANGKGTQDASPVLLYRLYLLGATPYFGSRSAPTCALTDWKRISLTSACS